MNGFVRSIDASAAGAFMDGGTSTGPRYLDGASLKAGTDAATAVIRETDGSGRILAVLGAGAAGETDHWVPPASLVFTGKVFVVLTGTTPTLILYEG